MNSVKPFTVFYDSHCPLCLREIEMIRRHDKDGKLTLTDISDQSFEVSSTGKTLDELMREIHGQYADGTMVVGVDVFREIYTRLGWGRLVSTTQLPLIKWGMDIFYKFFASLRYRAALRRYNRQHCDLPIRNSFPDRHHDTRGQSPSPSQPSTT